MIGTTHTGRRTAHEDALPYRFVGPERFTAWGEAADAVVPFAHGTEGDDTFTGTDADERYLGLGGNDTLTGGGGDDHLFGGDGDDQVDGGKGDDVLSGGPGRDIIYCGAGDDDIKYVSGVDGDDIIYGQDGNDHLVGSGGRLIGGGGDDYCGANYADLSGGAGQDYLVGSESRMDGGAGNDRLQLGDPFLISDYRHELRGGSGADSFIFVAAPASLGGGQTTIYDLTSEDQIDLSSIDAKEYQPGKQDFELVSEYNGKAGTVTITYDAANDRTLIELYTDNFDRKADGTIIVPGNHADFVNFVF